MNTRVFRILGLCCSVVCMVWAFQNCSGGGGGQNTAKSAAPAGLGAFVDDPVAGLAYTTSSGLSGVTNSLGQFQFNPGDTVTFSALGVVIGSTTPTISNSGTATITPINLVPGATGVTDPTVTAIAQFLNTLNTIASASSPGATGTFMIPTNSSLQTELASSSSTSVLALVQGDLQTILNDVFGSETYTVTVASYAQASLQTGVNGLGISGTVWTGVCSACSGGATFYFQPNGVLSGLTGNGAAISGSWSVDSSGNAAFSGAATDNGYGNNGVISAGSNNGTLQIYNQAGTFQGQMTLTLVSNSSGVTNSSWVGLWYVTATPNPGSSGQNNQGGCASLIVGPNTFSGVTNDGQAFSGTLSSSGTGSASFSSGSGASTTMNLNMLSLTGNYSQSSGGGTLSFSHSGSCTISNNGNNGGGGNGGGSGSGSSSGGGSLVVPINISWANSATSANSIIVVLTVYDSSPNQLVFTNQSDTSGSANTSGGRSSTTNEIAASWSSGVGATYTVTVSNVSPCTVANGSGAVTGGSYPTAQIVCN